MNSRVVLSNELGELVEARMRQTLEGIEETLQSILDHQEIGFEDLKETMQSLERSFNILFQKWNLQILYTLFLRKTLGFGELKRTLEVNSRTLSDKLKSLNRYGYINRAVEQGPPIKVKYYLTSRGRDTILLALPLLYYTSSYFT